MNKKRLLTVMGSSWGGYTLDFSALPDGSILDLQGAAWEISSGKATNTITLDATEVIRNGTFDSDEYWYKGTDWTISGGTANADTTAAGIRNNTTITASTWYYGSLDLTVSAGGFSIFVDTNGAYTRYAITSTGSYTFAGASTSSVDTFGIYGSNPTSSGTVDNVSLKKINVDTLICYKDKEFKKAASVSAIYSTANAGFPAGVFGWWDKANPMQNCIVAYHNGNYAILEKYVGTTRTELLRVAISPVSGAEIEIKKITSTTFELWYNNAKIGTTQTISDAAIINNGYFGLMSAGGANLASSFSINP